MLLLALILLAILALGSGAAFTASASRPSQANAGAPVGQSGPIMGPFISQAAKSDVSPPLNSLPIIQTGPVQGTAREIPRLPIPGSDQAGPQGTDSVLQKMMSPFVMPTPIVNVEGQINYWGVYPPDTVGDVGSNHYVQMVNSTGVLVLDKAGTRLGGPYNFNELFRGFGGLCESNQNGDPIVLHDQMADRWFLSQFAFTSQSGPTFQCFAISTSPDPLGSYYRYAFQTATVGFDDYPHYGIWPDAYYFSANRFNAPGFAGAVGAFERQRMIEGDPTARMVIFLNPNNGGHLPSDMDGGMLPPAGSPNYYLFPTNPGTGTISEYKFHVDWSNPALSTFTGPFPITVAPWDSDLCPTAREACIPQPDTAVRLEAIADRFMHRLAYRNFGTHESLVTKHTVDADGSGRAGVRWYEIRDPNGNRTVHQQGTYAPADGHHRWMGSIAMDRQGNMAAGYSVSSGTLYPSIRYAGRLVSDPVGQFTQGEATLIAGGGSETGPAGRWGDYSSMNIDPRDDCTFWYTTEYFNVTGLVNWKTRIGSFRFPGCVGGTATPVATATAPVPPTFTVLPSPTSCPGGVSTTGSITNSDPTQVGAVVGGVPSSCGTTATCPGQSSIPDPRHYDSYTLTNNSGSTQCVTVRIDASACQEAGVGSVAYLGSFDPNMVCVNYLASSGSNGPRYSYSFSVPAGATYVVVVRELSPDNGCAAYNINISPCGPSGGTATPGTSTPTITVVPSLTVAPTISTPTVPPTIGTATIAPTIGTATATRTMVTMSPTATVAGGTPTATPCNVTFTDVPPGHTFYAEIRCLAYRCIVSGYADGKFRPDNLVTRSQLAKIVSNAAGLTDNPGGQIFQDVPPGHPFYDWINRLTLRGYMTGYNCGSPGEPCVNNRPYFRPYNNATRAQTSKIVSNAAQFSDTPRGQTFQDVPSDHPFYVWIERLASRGVMGGYECGGPEEPCIPPGNRAYFRPYNDVTRGQAAKIVANTFFPGCQTP
jgi:hypothetical protein